MLPNTSGCGFVQASVVASSPRPSKSTAIELHVDAALPHVAWMNATFEEHAKALRSVVAVFPRVHDETSLVAFLNALVQDGRWQLRRGSKRSPNGGVLVGLEWTTPDGDKSETMGFAPFGLMPVPRRAPYVAIATWPAGRSNPYRGIAPTPPGIEGVVSFLDAAHGLEANEYANKWSATVERVNMLMTVPPDDARLYRRTTFVLSAAAADTLVWST